MILILSISSFQASAANTSFLEKVSNKDFGVILASAHMLETYFSIYRMTGKSSLDFEEKVKSHGVALKSKIPAVVLKKGKLQFAGISESIDLSKLLRGSITVGKYTHKIDPNQSDLEKFDSFMKFLARRNQSANAWNGLIPSADAFDPNATAKTIKASAATLGGIFAGAMSVGVALSWAATHFVSHTNPVLPTVAKVVALALAAEGLIKYGVRTFKGTSIVCENGAVYLKTKGGKLVDLSNKGEGILASVLDSFSYGQVGAVELNVRRALCKNSTSQATFLKNLSAGLQPQVGQAGPSTLDDSATAK